VGSGRSPPSGGGKAVAARPLRVNPGEVRRDVGQLRAVETPRGPRAAARDVSLRKRWPEEAAPR
jgi:hypothetical protein